MSIAYSYLRFSHPSQAEGNSIERQTEAAADWCQRNGIPLDTMTTFRDLGRSALRGDHRRNPDRNALALFLEMSEPGPRRRIPAGSYLIVESLDRLTREHVQPALRLILDILASGIKIVQLKPSEVVYDDKSDMFHVMLMIAELQRGHSESAMKSDRIGKAWKAKKLLARTQGKPMRSTPPPWLTLSGGRYRIHAPSARTICRIFRLTIDGHGLQSICRILTSERVPALVKSGRWSKNFVHALLTDRRVLGEYQPKTRVGGRLEKEGDPVPGFYPQIIDERTWERAREAISSRLRHRGRAGCHANVFRGILMNPVDGGKFYCTSRRTYTSLGGKNPATRIIVNHEGLSGRAKIVSFPFDVFERAILERLKEIDPKAIRGEDRGSDELDDLLAERRKKAERAKQLEELLSEDEGENPQGLSRALKKIEDRIEEIDARVAELRRLQLNNASEEWPEGKTLIDAILKHPEGQTQARLYLRSILYKSLDGIWLVIAGRSHRHIRVCLAQVFFKGSSARRAYTIWFRPRLVSHGKTRIKAAFYVADYKIDGPLDLRNRSQAERVQIALSALLPPDSDWREWPPKGSRQSS